MGVELVSRDNIAMFEADLGTKLAMIVGAGAEITSVQFSTARRSENTIMYSALVIFQRKSIT